MRCLASARHDRTIGGEEKGAELRKRSGIETSVFKFNESVK
jgi:hypothetical protein